MHVHHDSLIPHNERSRLQKCCQLRILTDVACGRVVEALHRDLETWVCSAASVQQQCSNARRCHSNSDPTLCAHGAQQATVEKGFFSVAKAIDKKCRAVDSGHDIVIDSPLLRVKLRHALISHGRLRCRIIPSNFVYHHNTGRLGHKRRQAKCCQALAVVEVCQMQRQLP